MKYLLSIALLCNLLMSKNLDIAFKYINELLKNNTNKMSECGESNNTKCFEDLSRERTSLILIKNILNGNSKLEPEYFCIKSKFGSKYNLRNVNNTDEIITLVKDGDKVKKLSDYTYKVNTLDGKEFDALMVRYMNYIGLIAKNAIQKCKK